MLMEKMAQYGVVPELECFDSAMINYANHLIHKGVLTPPHYFNVIVGNISSAVRRSAGGPAAFSNRQHSGGVT